MKAPEALILINFLDGLRWDDMIKMIPYYGNLSNIQLWHEFLTQIEIDDKKTYYIKFKELDYNTGIDNTVALHINILSKLAHKILYSNIRP